jgi:hypothetical protein
MKIKFFYFDASKYTKHNYSNSTNIIRSYDLLDAPKNLKEAYCQYLLSSLSCDFAENRKGTCDKVLYEIKRIENNEIKNYFFEGDELFHYANRESVLFESAIFGVSPHWPLWSCPFSHYKIAVQAARDFYAMPVSLDTELVVELPESDMAQITIFPPKFSERDTSAGIQHD